MKGFVYWQYGLIFVLAFLIVVGIACFFVAYIGSHMINDIGNHPSKSAKIQFDAMWKLLLAEVFSFALLLAFYSICVYLSSST